MPSVNFLGAGISISDQVHCQRDASCPLCISSAPVFDLLMCKPVKCEDGASRLWLFLLEPALDLSMYEQVHCQDCALRLC